MEEQKKVETQVPEKEINKNAGMLIYIFGITIGFGILFYYLFSAMGQSSYNTMTFDFPIFLHGVVTSAPIFLLAGIIKVGNVILNYLVKEKKSIN